MSGEAIETAEGLDVLGRGEFLESVGIEIRTGFGPLHQVEAEATAARELVDRAIKRRDS